MIVLDSVSKQFPGGVKAMDRVSFEVMEGETLVLLGTSGSGKTTTLKTVNRLIEPTSGRIFINGKNILEADPVKLRLNTGYAIQHIGLFPHMTVGENIAVVPGLKGTPPEESRKKAAGLLSMVGMIPEEYIDRYPSQLSGGQKQRVGVARALAADPSVVLMDEPFGALDPITREQLQQEFRELESEIQKTVLFVTHDIFEAVRMGDRIALMDGGRLQQIATPAELVENPANEFVDAFLGSQRFQLSLLTRNIGDITEKNSGKETHWTEDSPTVNTHHSLLDALDIFKKSGKQILPVINKNKKAGELGKKDLLSAISKVLGETGE
ncbi:MAG: ABC transporter ATP-binding protein [Fibrobacterota bacterium]